MVKEVTVIGGGTGSYTVLKGLKKYVTHGTIRLNAIVSMFDSGGSTGRLRDELGVLPPGDLRRCLIALADDSGENYLRPLFQYRFQEENGSLEGTRLGDLLLRAIKKLYPADCYAILAQITAFDTPAAELLDYVFDQGSEISGHSLGNLIISAAEKKYGTMGAGVEKLRQLLRLQGNVYPVSLANSHLHARLLDATVIHGETYIDLPIGERAAIDYVYLEPTAHAYEEAVAAIQRSDLLVIGPGDLYTSIIPNFLVGGIPQAIQQSRAQLVYVCNLMTKQGETDEYTANDFVRTIERYLGRKTDRIICTTNTLDADSLARYAQERQFPVQVDMTDARLVLAPLMHQRGNLVRHHRERLAELITQPIV